MKLKNLLLTAGLLLGASANADAPSTHGMVLFGNQTTYLSHLPMFHSPHDYQTILKVSLSDISGSQTLKTYETEKQNGTNLFTLVPEKMDLTKVIDGTITNFQGTIYKGHFENSGKALGLVEVKIEKLIFGRKIMMQTFVLGLTNFIFFGEKGEYYSLHLIENRPSYDQILKITKPHQNGVCGTRLCEEVSKEIPDSDLPVTAMASNTPTDHSAVGESIGETIFAGPQATILGKIYYEDLD